MNDALELWKQKLEDDIFIIPVRYEECDIPQKLQSLQWVNLFDVSGPSKLYSSIQEGMRRLKIVWQEKKDWEHIDNPKLIEDNFRHINFELDYSEPNYFRIAKESHQALFRSMIEALRGTANLDITDSRDPNKSVKFQYGNDPWMEIHKINVPGCKVAWRYSEPIPCDEPIFSEDQENIFDQPSGSSLISFWDALSKVQTTPFMRRYVHSKPVIITDKEMKILEWLHLKIKDEFDKFMPKLYATPVPDLIRASALCIKIVNELLFQSGMVIRSSFWPKELESLILSVESKIRAKNSGA